MASEKSENAAAFKDKEIVWVKLARTWWPAEICEESRVPNDMRKSRKTKPIAYVRFFEEDKFDVVRNILNICKYEDPRKEDFIRKGLADSYRANNKYMEKFPLDVTTAERLTNGDPNIITRDDFMPQTKKSTQSCWADIFKPERKSAGGASPRGNKISPKRGRYSAAAAATTPIQQRAGILKKSVDHEVRILTQPITPPTVVNNYAAKTPEEQTYRCHLCNFSSKRVNVVMLHSKSHTNNDSQARHSVTKQQAATSTTSSPIAGTYHTSPGDKADVEIKPINIDITPPVKSTPAKKKLSIKRKAAKESTISDDIQKIKPTIKKRKASIPAIDVVPVVESVPIEDTEENNADTVSVVEAISVTKAQSVLVELNHVELKDDLLADWSEDEAEFDRSVLSTAEGTTSINNGQNGDDIDNNSQRGGDEEEMKSDTDKKELPAVVSPTTIKYRNIPKKDRGRDFIFNEVTTKSPVDDVCMAAETNGDVKMDLDTIKSLDDVGKDEDIEAIVEPVTVEEALPEVETAPVNELLPAEMNELLPVSEVADVPELKTNEGEEEECCNTSNIEPETVANNELLSTSATSKASEIFDFQDDEDLEPLKSPPRRQRQRKSLLSSNDSREEIDKHIETKDSEIKMEIENLLKTTSPPKLPEIPKLSSTRLSSNDDSEMDDKKMKNDETKDRTLPPKERGKRIFKSKNRNRITIESEMDIIRKDIIESSGGDIGILATRNYRTESDIQIAEALINIPAIIDVKANVDNIPENTNSDNHKEALFVEATPTELNTDVNAIPVSRKKLLQAAFKAEEEKNMEKNLIIQNPAQILTSPPSLSPKQKFVQKLKEEQQNAKFEVRTPKKRKPTSSDEESVAKSTIPMATDSAEIIDEVKTDDLELGQIANDFAGNNVGQSSLVPIATENAMAIEHEEPVAPAIIPQEIKTRFEPDVVPKTSHDSSGQDNRIENNIIKETDYDNVFDINSMPIVLSNEPITAENIDSMPIVIAATDKEVVIPPIVTTPVPTPPKSSEKVSRKSKKCPKKAISLAKLLEATQNLLEPIKPPQVEISVPLHSSNFQNTSPTRSQTSGKRKPSQKMSDMFGSEDDDDDLVAPLNPMESTDSDASTSENPKRQIISTGSGGQIVITSKGQLITTNTSTSSTAHSFENTITSVSVASSIQSTQITSKSKIQVQSQHIICTSTKDETSSSHGHKSSATAKTKKSREDKHKLIRMSQQKLAEMTKLGFIKEKPQGKVLTSSGYKRMQEQLNQKKQDVVEKIPPLTPISVETNNKSNKTTPVKSSTKSAAGGITPKKSSSSSTRDTNKTPEAAVPPPSSSIFETPSPQASPAPAATSPLVTNQAAAATTSSPTTEVTENYFACAAETFGGPPNSFYLCRIGENNQYIPIDNRALYLDAFNQLVEEMPEHLSIAAAQESSAVIDSGAQSGVAAIVAAAAGTTPIAGDNILSDLNQMQDVAPQTYIINTGDGQQIILDQQSLLAFASGEMPHLITADGQQIILQGSPQEIISALVNQQELGIISGDQQIILPQQLEQDCQSANANILAVALEGTDVYQTTESLIGDVSNLLPNNPLHNEIVANQTVPTAAVLSKPPIMSTLEVPTSSKKHLSINETVPIDCGLNIEDSLAAIGVSTTHSNVPSSLELPITVTNPAIASKTSPLTLNTIYTPPISAINALGGHMSQMSPSLGYDLFDTTASTAASKMIMQSKESHTNVTRISQFSTNVPDELLHHQQRYLADDEEDANGEQHHRVQQPSNLGDDDDDDGGENIIPQSPDMMNITPSTPPVAGADDDEHSNTSDEEIPMQPSNFIEQSNQNNNSHVQENHMNESNHKDDER